MSVILRACFRSGSLLSAIGIACIFARLADVTLGFILLGLIIIHLAISMWTANRPTSYNTYRECFTDIMGDLTSYSILFAAIFIWWLLLPRVSHFQIVGSQYWFAIIFLIVMCLITLFEMVVTIRSCLIALERLNPITLAPPTA